jgi:uncharacterized protein YkwD
MTSLKIASSSCGSFSAKLRNCLTASTLLTLASLMFCPSSSAQTIQLPPMARLVSEPDYRAAASRPRRVTKEEGSPVMSKDESDSVSPSFDEASSIERQAFEKTNQARVENGMKPLAWDAELCSMARAHSESMASLGFFSHETLEGLQLKDRARSRGIPRFRVIGENIAYNKGYKDPGAFAVERWMNSSGHRANILYIGFQASGIGSYISNDGTVYLTQIFIAR